MSQGCEYCKGYINILYFNNLDDKGAGGEITLGVSEDGWYFEVNSDSEEKREMIVSDKIFPAKEDETPLNYCPVCGNKLNNR